MAAQDLYTVAELAAKWRVSRDYIYDRIADGTLRSTDLGVPGGRAKTRIPEKFADAFWAKRTEALEAKGLRGAEAA